ncbi:hypothetical protein RFI_22133 [Reticulomyxa filosa]|uniref:Uncharacterized protein n=1 Tax=Reticulomyxa filosa TaxID=46433 RepID=X6MQ57_RETFI|nr:hypothetical protein RFI_22133 [Reticulomyxa filosa]|eukprot:ETO15230.1 hypothetical protein RFI_22133 [Reticulomyxa filosa]
MKIIIFFNFINYLFVKVLHNPIIMHMCVLIMQYYSLVDVVMYSIRENKWTEFENTLPCPLYDFAIYLEIQINQKLVFSYILTDKEKKNISDNRKLSILFYFIVYQIAIKIIIKCIYGLIAYLQKKKKFLKRTLCNKKKKLMKKH